MALTTPTAHDRELAKARQFLETFPEFGLKDWDYKRGLTPRHPDGQTIVPREQRTKTRSSQFDATVSQRCSSVLPCGHVLPRQSLTDAEIVQRVNLPPDELRDLWISALRRPRWCRACERKAAKLASKPRICAAEGCDNTILQSVTGRPRKYCREYACELIREAERKRRERAA